MRYSFQVFIFVVGLYSVSLCYDAIILDPGHGGPGGGKYGSNGDGAGAVGPNDLTEEWVNLQVANRTKFLIEADWFFMTPILTRSTDTTFRSLPDRVQFAKTYDALYFLSVHHNGLGPTLQATSVWWSSDPQDDSGHYRSTEARDSTFAKKVLLRLRETWRYQNHCGTATDSSAISNCDDYTTGGDDSLYIVRNIYHCYVALSEASNIGTANEAALFADEGSGHIGEEGGALFHGMHSHYNNMGFARISNRYIGGPGQIVGVDGVEWSTPVEFTWEAGENHELVAWQNFYHNGRTYTFHHWAHLSCDDCFIDSNHTSRYYDVIVPPEYEWHIYRAYFTGGPYSAEFEYLPWPMRYAAGDTVLFAWWCNWGVDSTSEVNLYLDRHNGRDGYPEQLAADAAWRDSGYINWVVTGPACDSCIFKVVAHDIAGNQATGYTQDMETFAICTWKVGDADGSGAITISDAVYLIDHIFGPCEGCPSGPPPTPHNPGSGDADCSGSLSISDAVYLINYFFAGGPPPGQVCNCADYE